MNPFLWALLAYLAGCLTPVLVAGWVAARRNAELDEPEHSEAVRR